MFAVGDILGYDAPHSGSARREFISNQPADSVTD